MSLSVPDCLRIVDTMRKLYPKCLVLMASVCAFGLVLALTVLDQNAQAQDAPTSVGPPSSVQELIESLKMTEEQAAAFQVQETLRKGAQAKLQQLTGKERRAAADAFQATRREALQELFTEEQWKRWDNYWTAYWSRQNNVPEPKENPGPPQPAIPLDAPDFGKATGRFQVAKMNGRASLVTPEGKAFFSLGVTHIVAIGAPAKDEPNVLVDRFGGDWSVMASKANENLRSWGYNSTGYGTPRPLGQLIPYVE